MAETSSVDISETDRFYESAKILVPLPKSNGERFISPSHLDAEIGCGGCALSHNIVM